MGWSRQCGWPEYRVSLACSSSIQGALTPESRRLAKYAQRVDQVERRVSEAEDEHYTLTTAQKKKLRNLKLDYNMLLPAWLRVMVGGKALIFTDSKKLQQFIAKKEAKGQRRNVKTAGSGDADKEMDDVRVKLGAGVMRMLLQ
ncbi:hypothetical protein NDU88_004854 [Pleurodeles waltl]|uniref:Uncharacterized protein n=1 Tax=Pleurodeles waltl TaxID=8319 RepID=A0AAV7MYE9_PLEWA|nr:hypothetical protein NDU88_004854 [Pleurodeles waltl]